MNSFEERLIDALFPEVFMWSNDYIATYVLHIPSHPSPVFFKKMTSDIFELAMAHEDTLSVYAVKNDGAIENVTEAWCRVFDKQKSARASIEELLVRWKEAVPNTIATFEVKLDNVTVGYFREPTLDILKTVSRLRGLSILAIHKTGAVEDVTTAWKPMFEEYLNVRSQKGPIS